MDGRARREWYVSGRSGQSGLGGRRGGMEAFSSYLLPVRALSIAGRPIFNA